MTLSYRFLQIDLVVFTFYAFYVCTAGLPAVYFSILASSVIVIAAVPGLLPPLGIPALGFRLQIPELGTRRR